MTKREAERLARLIQQPEVAARLQQLADGHFAERAAVVINAVKKECRHESALNLAFFSGVFAAFNYRDNPPPALARYARTLAAQIKKMPKPKTGQACWYCQHKPPKRHAPACPFFGVRVGREHP